MKNKVVKNTTMLYLMNLAKMIFQLVTLPYLTRVLTVDCYGVVSFVKAAMQYMQLIVDFGFILSGTKDIVMYKDDKKKLNYEVGNILASKIVLSIAAGAVLFVSTLFIPLLRENLLYTVLSFAVVFLSNFLFDFLFRGLEKMEIITVRFLVMRGLSTALTFMFVHSDADVLWIPILDIIGSALAVLLVVLEINKLNIKLKCSGFSAIIQKIKESAIYFFSNMATTAFMALNTLLIGMFLNNSDVAYWSLCLQMVSAVQALYTPITDGIYPHMVKTKDIGILKKAIKIFVPLISAGCIFTLFAAKYALLIVGGEQYVGAAYVLRALVPVLFFSFLSMLFGWPALGAIGKQKETTFSTIITAVVQVLGLLLLIASNNFNLLNIALLRGMTELLLFVLRFSMVIKYKSEFSNTDENKLKNDAVE